MFRCKGHVAAAAAGGVSAHEAGLADTGFVSATAQVTVDQLTGRHKDCVPAVADTIPQYPAVFKKSRRGVHGITAVTPANPHDIAVFSLVYFMAVNLPKRMPVRSLFLLMSISTSCRPLSECTYRSDCTNRKEVGW